MGTAEQTLRGFSLHSLCAHTDGQANGDLICVTSRGLGVLRGRSLCARCAAEKTREENYTLEVPSTTGVGTQHPLILQTRENGLIDGSSMYGASIVCWV